MHSRSPTNQQLNFHFMYGGFKRYWVDRYLVGSLYRNGFRAMWFPGFLMFVCNSLPTQSAATTCVSTTTPPTTSSTSPTEVIQQQTHTIKAARGGEGKRC